MVLPIIAFSSGRWSFNFEPEDGPYQSMYCEMCRQAHMVNVKTGKVLGADDDDVETANSG